MSLLITLSTAMPAPSGQSHHALQQIALAEALRQGFTGPRKLSWATGSAWWFQTPGMPVGRGSGACVSQGQRFAASVGAFHWRGLAGDEALHRLLARAEHPRDLPLDELSGSFAMLFGGPKGVWLFNDTLGLHKIYASALGALRSSSLMVCRAALRRPTLRRMRAQEYVLFGATHGPQTPLEGLDICAPSSALNLETGEAFLLHPPQRLRQPLSVATAEQGVDAVTAAIAQEFAQLGQAFAPDIGMALSGGFDSRLLLAAMDHVQVTPQLYVYGKPADEDVVIAKSVAQRLGLPILCTDKSMQARQLPALNARQLKDNYAFFDGLPIDGVFDRGMDQQSRLQQVQGGRLNLNGGGGEILRNFFYLPEGHYSAANVVGAFYSGWLDEVFPSAQERRQFVLAMQDSVLDALGLESGSATARQRPLARAEIELVYTQFRLRYWMGRNNSMAARYGRFMTPLVTPRLVALAAPLPIAWKDCGALEAAVISRLSPRVAAGPSAYGFAFDAGPRWRDRLAMATTLHRPVWLRHHSLRVRRWLGRAPSAQVPAEWRDAAPGLPAPDWINPAALCAPEQLNRLLTLQGLLDADVCGVATAD